MRSRFDYPLPMEHTHTDQLGPLLRTWRQKRRMSQLELAGDAEISTRHLSFVETGRARPSREVLLRLAESLALPLRESNALLLAAGLAPGQIARMPEADAYAAIEAPLALLLEGHHPYPAIAIDRYWTIRKANRAVYPLLTGVSPALLTPPMNAIRISLHPEGLAPRIDNIVLWREHLLHRLQRQIQLTDDAALKHLLHEVSAYPVPADARPIATRMPTGPVIPMTLRVNGESLNLISTTTIFGSPIDVEVSELAIETFFPGDEATRQALLRLA